MGSGIKSCNECGVNDDESHRINDCQKYRAINKFDHLVKVDFESIYSDELENLMPIVETILSLWDLGHNKNNMKDA